ncbi:MAG: lytic murein transglycosylase [Parcubacteria group bacterium]
MRLKPKVLVDITHKSGKDPYAKVKARINLSWSPENKKNIPKIAIKFPLAIFGALAMICFGSVFAPTLDSNAQTTVQSPEERAALEKELADLETKIAEYEKTVQGYQRQGSTLKEEIDRLNAQINKMNLQVKAITLNLSKLDGEIGATTEKISDTESEMEQKKAKIAAALRDIDKNENQNLVEILLTNPSLSDFFGNINNILIVQNSLSDALHELQGLREDYVEQKEQLGIQKTDAESLRTYQESQKKAVESLKKDKNEVLTVTKGKEAEYQKLLTETKKTAAEIRARLYHMVGGGEMTFEEAYGLAKFAESATGIRAALLLAVLDQESALGKNVGRCDYQTAMHPTRDIPAFLQIIAELGLQQELAAGNIKVSCPIISDGAYGGAMGPAQFIPSTWVLYKDKIAQVTGVKPANPWNNRDAFVATSLYLQDAYNSADCRNYGSANKNVLPEQTLRERCAAAKYYAGNRWYTYRFAYGEPVLDRAAGFEGDIAVLNSSQASR